jgi:hypothetical protein
VESIGVLCALSSAELCPLQAAKRQAERQQEIKVIFNCMAML